MPNTEELKKTTTTNRYGGRTPNEAVIARRSRTNPLVRESFSGKPSSTFAEQVALNKKGTVEHNI